MRIFFIFLIGIFLVSCIDSGKKTKDTSNDSQLIDSTICAEINGTQLDGSIGMTSPKGDFQSLIDLPNKEQMLFVRYSNYGCKDCINLIVNGIRKRKLNAHTCFLIAEVPTIDLHVIQNTERLCGTYKLDSFHIDFDDGLTPYIFQINKKGEICHLHIPRIENPNAFELYLKDFKERIGSIE